MKNKTVMLIQAAAFLFLLVMNLPGQSVFITPETKTLRAGDEFDVRIALDTTSPDVTKSVTAFQACMELSDNLEIIDGIDGVVVYDYVWQLSAKKSLVDNRLELAFGSRSGGCFGVNNGIAQFTIRAKMPGDAFIRLIPEKCAALTPFNEEIISGNVVSGEYTITKPARNYWILY